jgi:thymus-specific serine protease
MTITLLRATGLAGLGLAAAAAVPHGMDTAVFRAADRHARSSPVPAPAGLAPARYFDQRLDHFDGTNAKNWSQAYYVNDTFWDPTDPGPVFLCVGGEGPAFDGSVVQASVHCNNAVEWLEENKAIMFAVQHRYYGCHPGQQPQEQRGAPAAGGHGAGRLVDCPIPAFTDDADADLKYLSSKQALADLALFHAYATSQYKLAADAKWISWGGSYPGMLAAWVRLKFPHLIHAAVSSSAPVRAKVEMTEYNDIAAAAYSVESVGGSAACTFAIAKGHATIGTLMGTDAGRAQLATQFPSRCPNADWLKSRDNQRGFAGEGVAYFPSQGTTRRAPRPCPTSRSSAPP